MILLYIIPRLARQPANLEGQWAQRKGMVRPEYNFDPPGQNYDLQGHDHGWCGPFTDRPKADIQKPRQGVQSVELLEKQQG